MVKRIDIKLILLLGMVLLSNILVWLPFWLRLQHFWGLDFSKGMMAVWANFDGPNYLIVARTWYSKVLIANQFSAPLPLEYYPAHWPFYPALISLLQTVLKGPIAMLMASLAGVIFFYLVFYKFLKRLGLKSTEAFWVGTASLVVPARWIIIRSIGSPEGWFCAFILLSLMAYRDKKYFNKLPKYG